MKDTNMPCKKLIAIDLDGTLLDSEKRISVRTQQALTRASDAGLEPVVVTGRPLSGLPEDLKHLPQLRYVITSNGAVTTDLQTGATLRSQLIDCDTAVQITRIPEQESWIYSVFLDGVGYCTEYSYGRIWDFFAGTPLESYVRNSRRMTGNIAGRIHDAKGVENIWIVCQRPDQASQLSLRIRETWQLQTFRTAPTDVETGALGADKGTALRHLYHYLHLRKEDVYAIGDNHNDLSMLKAAGTAVAMGNASDEIRQLADMVTQTNDNDGVACMIESLL